MSENEDQPFFLNDIGNYLNQALGEIESSASQLAAVQIEEARRLGEVKQHLVAAFARTTESVGKVYSDPTVSTNVVVTLNNAAAVVQNAAYTTSAAAKTSDAEANSSARTSTAATDMMSLASGPPGDGSTSGASPGPSS